MALTRTDRGAGSDGDAGESSCVAVPTSTIAAGSFGVLCVVADNSGTNGAAPYSGTLNVSTITDSVGNVWRFVISRLQDPGAANAGLWMGIFECPKLATALTSGGNVTIPFDQVTVARAYVFHQVSTNDPAMFVQSSAGTGASGSNTTPSSGAVSYASGELAIGFMGAEHNSAITPDSDSTNGSWSTHQTAGVGTTTSGIEISSQGKVCTGAGNQTYNLTITSADWTLHLRRYNEVAIPRGTVSSRQAVSSKVAGSKHAVGRVLAYIAVAAKAQTQKRALASAKAAVGATSSASAHRSTTGRVQSHSSVTALGSGSKATHGSVAATTGSHAELAGSKSSLGAARAQVAVSVRATTLKAGLGAVSSHFAIVPTAPLKKEALAEARVYVSVFARAAVQDQVVALFGKVTAYLCLTALADASKTTSGSVLSSVSAHPIVDASKIAQGAALSPIPVAALLPGIKIGHGTVSSRVPVAGRIAGDKLARVRLVAYAPVFVRPVGKRHAQGLVVAPVPVIALISGHLSVGGTLLPFESSLVVHEFRNRLVVQVFESELVVVERQSRLVIEE